MANKRSDDKRGGRDDLNKDRGAGFGATQDRGGMDRDRGTQTDRGSSRNKGSDMR